MPKTKKKVTRLAKKTVSAEKMWLGNPLFMAALITIMAVLAFILVDDWINMQNAAAVPSLPPQVTIMPKPSVTIKPVVTVKPMPKVTPVKK